VDELLIQLEKLYFLTAVSTAPHALESLLAPVPAAHLLFGTEVPFGQGIGLRYTLRGIDSYPGFSDDERAGILRRNADLLLHHHSPAIGRTDHSESMNVATNMILICANVY
jgi:predicted TIM-barrel fold metal-dependent hydrolase